MKLEEIYLPLSGEKGFMYDSLYHKGDVKCYKHGLRGHDSYEGIIYPALPLIRVLVKKDDKILIAVAKSIYEGYENPVIEVAPASIMSDLITLDKALDNVTPMFKKVYSEETWNGKTKQIKTNLEGKYKVNDEENAITVRGYENDYSPVNVYYESPYIAICEKTFKNEYKGNPYFVQNEVSEGKNYTTLPNHGIDYTVFSAEEMAFHIKELNMLFDPTYIETAINKKLMDIYDKQASIKYTIKHPIGIIFPLTPTCPTVEEYIKDIKKIYLQLEAEKKDVIELAKLLNLKPAKVEVMKMNKR